jgi:ABC-type nickel/cobalt efflux system permease component RcnA
MKTLNGFSIMIGIAIIMNWNPQLALILQKVGAQFNGSIKQVKGRGAVFAVLVGLVLLFMVLRLLLRRLWGR